MFFLSLLSLDNEAGTTTKVTSSKTYQFDGNGNDFRETNLQEAHDTQSTKIVETQQSVGCLYQFLVLYQRHFMCSRRNCVSINGKQRFKVIRFTITYHF